MSFINKLTYSAAAAVLFTSAAQAGQFTIENGKTKPLRLSGDAASVVIGNPNVADVAVHNSNLLFVSGKSFGVTNLLVFDKAGKTLYEADVVVTTNTASVVSINRAGASYTYDCSPACRPTLAVGDDQGHFNQVREQVEGGSTGG